MNTTPKVYLSTSNGQFRVINQGMPISKDMATAQDAMQVARAFRLDVAQDAWNGDTGEFMPIDAVMTA